jgi:serine phosphatase RsbU (regulator of sigma subunit)
VPLRAERRTLGALVTRVPADGTDPPEAELALLGDVAERCALAIERARSYEQRNHEARALQESLLPPQLPLPPGLVVAAGFHAAGDLARLGGDFYDVFELDQGRWAAVVGDIRGKGPQAAVVTARVRHSLRAICDQFSSPAAALGKLNALLLATPEDAMCTVALAYLATDELGTDVALSLAGHPAPLVQARDGDLRQAGAFNALLGAFPAATWEDTSFRLEAGERLVVFTDGMLDQRRSGQRGLVEDELLECLRSLHDAPAQEVADRLVAWTVREQEGQPVDDTAVLVVQSAPETLPAAGRAALAA